MNPKFRHAKWITNADGRYPGLLRECVQCSAIKFLFRFLPLLFLTAKLQFYNKTSQKLCLS